MEARSVFTRHIRVLLFTKQSHSVLIHEAKLSSGPALTGVILQTPAAHLAEVTNPTCGYCSLFSTHFDHIEWTELILKMFLRSKVALTVSDTGLLEESDSSW